MPWLCALVRRPWRPATDRVALTKRTWRQNVQHIAPIFRWLPQYRLQRDLKYDLVAGLTVAMMLVPQEVSLSTIMHVPAHHGLYTAALAPMVYAIFGSSTVLSVASGSEVSLLVGSLLETIESEDERVATGVFMAFLSGSILLLIRLLKLSPLADFFSRPVMGGFISASGLLIMLSQVPNALGLLRTTHEFPPTTVVQICRHLGGTNFTACGVAAVSLVYLFLVQWGKQRLVPSRAVPHLFKTDVRARNDRSRAEGVERSRSHAPDTTYHVELTPLDEHDSQDARKRDVTTKPSSKALPGLFCLRTLCDLGPLIVCIFGALVGYVMGPSHLQLTGAIPRGFPEPTVPWYGLTSHLIASDRLGTILYHTSTVAIVVLLSSIAMAKRLALQRGEAINTEQELTGIGMASIVCGFFQAVPPTGGMSRTAVNLQSAHTQLASIITSLFVVCALYTLTGILYYLPRATLAAIIIGAGWRLVEFREAKWLYRVKRDECFVWWASFALTLGLGVRYGLMASILCCVLALMWKSKVQPVATLVELESGNVVNRNNVPTTPHLSDIIGLRVERSLYFGNCERVAQMIDQEMQRLSIVGVGIRGVVLDTGHMNDMDATTIQVLSDTQEKLAVQKVWFAIANAKPRLVDLLAATNLPKRIVAGDSTISVGDAVHRIRELPRHGDTRW